MTRLILFHIPFVPGGENEVYLVLATLLISLTILYFFGRWWQQ